MANFVKINNVPNLYRKSEGSQIRGEIEQRKKEFLLDLKKRFGKESQNMFCSFDVSSERIKNFFDKNGLKFENEKLVLVSEKNVNEYSMLFAKHFSNLSDEIEPTKDELNPHGVLPLMLYNPDLDIVLVYADKLKDKLKNINPKEKGLFVESLLVHEFLHSNYGIYNAGYTKSDKSYFPNKILRSGFVTQNWNSPERLGEFLEEGFVRYMQSKYVGENRDPVERDRIENYLKEKGFSYQEINPDHVFLNEKDIVLTGYEEFKIKQHELLINSYDYAGFTFRLLCTKRPDLERHLIDFRKSGDAKFLKIAVGIINDIMPGLYKKMRSLKYGEMNSSTDWESLYKEVNEFIKQNQ